MNYACERCGKIFSSEKSLINHASYHKSNITPFYFFTDIGQYTGNHAISLMDFSDILQNIDVLSIEFHLYRGDFQNWICDIGGYKSLVNDFDQLMKRGLKGEFLRSRLRVLIQRALRAPA